MGRIGCKGRLHAIFTLGEWADRESLPPIREAAKSRSLRVQKAARAAIEKLSREQERR